MKSFCREADRVELRHRLKSVREDSGRRWGSMTAHQMVCHLGDAFLMMLGERRASDATGPLQRTLIKWIALYGPLHWPAGIPTRPEVDQMIGGTKPEAFITDVARVEALMDRAASAVNCAARPHPIFGRMSERAWMRWAYLHTDHHLRQFGASLLLAALMLSGCASATPPAPATRPQDIPPREQWLQMFARGYFPGRSGQVFVVPKQGRFVASRDPLYAFEHGSPWEYDTHVPLLLYGAPFVKAGQYNEPARQQDVAPTVGAMIGASPLPTYTGRVLSEAVATGSARPRVVTVMVLDAMRVDYFDKYAGVMPTLTRLRKEGAWFSAAHTTVLPTVTSVGHANIGTGSEPRFHGIVVNRLFNRGTGKAQEVYDSLDARELMALTLVDQWNLTTDGKAVIIGQGGAIRATAGLVGQGACLVGGKKILAASYGGADGGWETNPTCYTMPDALKRFVGRKVWEDAGGTWMGHDIASAAKFRPSALFQKYEAEALRAVVEESSVGADDVTDLVFVNMKGPDYTAHAYGPDSKEQATTLAELDRQVTAYLQLIDKKAGPGRSVLVITADHGHVLEPPPGGRVYLDEIITQLNKRFDPEGRFINYYNDAPTNQMYLDTDRLQSRGFSLKDVAAFLETMDVFEAAFTEDEVRAAQARLPR